MLLFPAETGSAQMFHSSATRERYYLRFKSRLLWLSWMKDSDLFIFKCILRNRQSGWFVFTESSPEPHTNKDSSPHIAALTLQFNCSMVRVLGSAVLAVWPSCLFGLCVVTVGQGETGFDSTFLSNVDEFEHPISHVVHHRHFPPSITYCRQEVNVGGEEMERPFHGCVVLSSHRCVLFWNQFSDGKHIDLVWIGILREDIEHLFSLLLAEWRGNDWLILFSFFSLCHFNTLLNTQYLSGIVNN